MAHVAIPRAELEGPQVDPGTYPGRLDKAKIRKSQAQNDVMQLSWTLTGTEPPAGVKIPDQITLIPEAYWKLQALFAATGITPGDGGFDTDELIGAECNLVLVEDEYQGNKRIKVNGYAPL